MPLAMVFGALKKFFCPGTRFLPGHPGDSDKNAVERASQDIARHFFFQGGHLIKWKKDKNDNNEKGGKW